MLSIIDIKKTIKQHTADMDITDSVDYKISALPRFYNISTCYITHIGLIPLYIYYFRAQSNISAVPKQQGTILFSENGLIYPKTV
jgi:hypothetical protein